MNSSPTHISYFIRQALGEGPRERSSMAQGPRAQGIGRTSMSQINYSTITVPILNFKRFFPNVGCHMSLNQIRVIAFNLGEFEQLHFPKPAMHQLVRDVFEFPSDQDLTTTALMQVVMEELSKVKAKQY